MWRPPDFWADIIAVIAILLLLAFTLGGLWFNLFLATHGRNP